MNNSQLSAEQVFIATLPADAHTIVSAGPGTGKTHVLVDRVSQLLNQGLTASDILVLSFSRAAVGVVEARLKRIEGDAAYVRVRTLDSIALSILLRKPPAIHDTDASDSVSPHDLSFNDRILRATEFLLGSPETASRMLRFRHIIIDEVQDIVGWRAEFALALLKTNAPGFTLLGDGAQGIYDFSLTKEERIADLDSFAALVCDSFGHSTRRFTLTKNFRNVTPNRKLEELGSALSGGTPNFDLLCDELSTMIDKLLSVGTLASLARMLHNQGTHAILCSTRGDALYLTRELHRLGVLHTLRGDAMDRHWSRHMVKALHSIKKDSVTFEQFSAMYPTSLAHSWLSPHDAWKELRRIASSRGRFLVVKDIVMEMRSGRVHDNELTFATAKVVVSTVHRAKGLEFDTVYLYQVPFEYGSAAEGARAAYVALTRSRGKTFRIPPQGWAFSTNKTLDGRWRVPYRHNNFATRELELTLDDSADNLFPPGYALGLGRETQEYIDSRVRPNDELYLRRVDPASSDSRCDYEILHADRVVGLISGAGIDLGLQRIAGSTKSYSMPDGISGVYVDSIDAVAGLPGAGEQCGLGIVDVWLRVVTVGIGTLVWPQRPGRAS